MSRPPEPPPIKKVSQSEYIDLRSGELCEYKQSADRSENADSLRKTFRKVRDLINANCADPDRLHWVTLTYKDNMTDSKQLYSDFDAFRKRLGRYCKKRGLTPPEYISIAEPQSRGAWHLHLILIWSDKRPYISNNNDFAPMWGHGYTKIQACPDADNLGAYLSAYLGDIPLSEYTGDTTKANIKTVGGKRYVKGGRLSLYPIGMNVVRHSKGVKKPTSEIVPTERIEKEKAGSGTLTYKSVFTVSDAENEEKKTYIAKSYYNSKRTKSQPKPKK